MNDFNGPAWAPTQPTPHHKPTVRYIGPAEARAPNRARLIPLNHRHPIVTSRVLDWDRASGRIETLNTVYLPIKDGDGTDEMVARVGLPNGVPA
jgi:hypothetical protein